MAMSTDDKKQQDCIMLALLPKLLAHWPCWLEALAVNCHPAGLDVC